MVANQTYSTDYRLDWVHNVPVANAGKNQSIIFDLSNIYGSKSNLQYCL